MPRRPDTELVTAGRDPDTAFGFVNPPLVRGSTVLHHTIAEYRERHAARTEGTDRPVTYGIYGSPTHHAFYDALTELEGGYASWAFPSGLTACIIAILAFVRQGDHLLVPDSVYWPTRRFCRDTLARFGVTATFYDPRIAEQGRAAVEELFEPETRVLFLESPGSQTFEIQDVPLIADVARQKDAVSMIDNTWATPLYFRPLTHGVDISIHAATKYICGHSDVLMGTVTANEQTWPQLRQTIHEFGLTTSPDDVYLAHRGLHTLGARLRQHGATALRLAEWFLARPEVDRVLYPALESDPGHALWKRDFTGASGLFGVVLHPVEERRVEAFVDSLELFGYGMSWGGFESLITHPSPERTLGADTIDGPLLRIAAGLEDPDDLIEDLTAGFVHLGA